MGTISAAEFYPYLYRAHGRMTPRDRQTILDALWAFLGCRIDGITEYNEGFTLDHVEFKLIVNGSKVSIGNSNALFNPRTVQRKVWTATKIMLPNISPGPWRQIIAFMTESMPSETKQ